MTKGSFGEHLRREREMRGVSLDEICAATRIGTPFLEAIENEQWNRLPGGVFNRGFVRAVARFLGLDEEKTVAEYELATNHQTRVAAWPGVVPLRSKQRHRAPPRLMILLALAILAGGWAAWHQYSARAARAANANDSSSRPVQSAPPDLIPGSSHPASPPSQPAAHPRNQKDTQQTSAAPPSQPPLSGVAPLELTVAVAQGKKTAVKVFADGKRVFSGKMSAGKNQHFQAQDKFEIAARNSGALLLELNGRTVAPMGAPGYPGRVTLTRKDLTRPPGGSN